MVALPLRRRRRDVRSPALGCLLPTQMPLRRRSHGSHVSRRGKVGGTNLKQAAKRFSDHIPTARSSTLMLYCDPLQDIVSFTEVLQPLEKLPKGFNPLWKVPSVNPPKLDLPNALFLHAHLFHQLFFKKKRKAAKKLDVRSWVYLPASCTNSRFCIGTLRHTKDTGLDGGWLKWHFFTLGCLIKLAEMALHHSPQSYFLLWVTFEAYSRWICINGCSKK